MSVKTIEPIKAEDFALIQKCILKLSKGLTLSFLKKNDRLRISSLVAQARYKSKDEKEILLLDKLNKSLWPVNV
jgi:hypothetical protein